MSGVGAGPPLVTGASGFAGSHMVGRLLHAHPRVTAWGSGNNEGRGRVDWRRVDVTDRSAVHAALRAAPPSVVYHCAGLPHVVQSADEPARALEVNALGTHHLLTAVNEIVPDARVLVVSSALVYRKCDRALREDDELGPGDAYGVSKLAQEMTALRSGARVVVARAFNHIGPRQSDAFAASSFARQIAEIEAGRREPRLLVGNLESRRDILDVRDTVAAYEALATGAAAAGPYNVCSGVAMRVGDVLEHLLGLAPRKIHIEGASDRMRPVDNPLVLGDRSRITAETGWSPKIRIEETLRDLLFWWRAEIARRPA